VIPIPAKSDQHRPRRIKKGNLLIFDITEGKKNKCDAKLTDELEGKHIAF
jgi:hypothetical protein